MVAADLDELEQQLDPTARFVVAYLRAENERQRELLAQNSELIARLTEQVEALNRRLFGKSSEKMPTVAQQLRREVDPNELTVDGAAMPEQPEAFARERRRRARLNSEPERNKRRALRKDTPTITETVQVKADALPEGYGLDDFRVLGEGKVVHRVEHVAEHLVIQKYILVRRSKKLKGVAAILDPSRSV